ncbi:MAG: hypothetical protein ACOYKJ_05810 [Candidatus Howiella sp.]|jgi:uncharacterized phage-like protein YoqJ
MKEKTCCFFGHRTINETEELKSKLIEIIEKLIEDKKVDAFLFGSRSRFNSLCHELVTELKEKYPHIKRIYVRAEYPFIDESYREYILKDYEDTYYPQRMIGAGKASYVERNYEMIDKSEFVVVYCDENYAPPRRRNCRRDITEYQSKSGTKIALDYAINKCKNTISVL